ncbi:response regulator transcription factor [Microbispora sp. KK1-11]|uniref:response regulator transcription factor n=1 Tax=Microbispora sp. KK1-11 TaxID=2053005 RepID=UPI0011591086|nr:response regulator transcription factor [Microbispora sp. KK1-11]TQS25864.1 response regulator transcription factor [Microbispora sp. KK1-11]
MRVVIAEDSALLRKGITLLLQEAGHDVAAAVGDAELLLRAVAEHRPDIAVVDVRMPPTFRDEGLRAALLLRSEFPETAILVLSQYVEERYAAQLLAGDISGIGYLLKDRVADADDFLRILDQVTGGGTVFDQEVVAQILVRTRRQDPIQALTRRERDVLQLMAEGRSNGGIAGTLGVTPGAVEKYVTSIFAKFRLPPSENDHRRVLAVLRYLDG